jgi:hypothetical protein
MQTIPTASGPVTGAKREVNRPKEELRSKAVKPSGTDEPLYGLAKFFPKLTAEEREKQSQTALQNCEIAKEAADDRRREFGRKRKADEDKRADENREYERLKKQKQRASAREQDITKGLRDINGKKVDKVSQSSES